MAERPEGNLFLKPKIWTPAVIIVVREFLQGAGVFALPSQRQTGSVAGLEAGTLVRAAILNWGGAKMSPLLLTFSSEGVVKGIFFGGQLLNITAQQNVNVTKT